MKNRFEDIDQDFKELVVRSCDLNREVALAAQYELAVAVQDTLRDGILAGDISGVFTSNRLGPNEELEYALDLLAPGEEDEFVAYTNPGEGRIPEKTAEGDYVKIPTYLVAGSIDWNIHMARRNPASVYRYFELLEGQFVKKANDDGWHTILAAVADRNILVHDPDASAGQFTKRVVSLLRTTVVRNGGGNAASTKRFRLTDMFMSSENIEDMRNWGVDIIDEITRHEIYVASNTDGAINRIFGVNLHEMTELGEDQEYQNFFTGQLGGSLASSDTELIIGLDMNTNKDTFVMPVRENVVFFEDPALHRQQRAGYYGWAEWGFGVLDNRSVIGGSC